MSENAEKIPKTSGEGTELQDQLKSLKSEVDTPTTVDLDIDAPHRETQESLVSLQSELQGAEKETKSIQDKPTISLKEAETSVASVRFPDTRLGDLLQQLTTQIRTAEQKNAAQEQKEMEENTSMSFGEKLASTIKSIISFLGGGFFKKTNKVRNYTRQNGLDLSLPTDLLISATPEEKNTLIDTLESLEDKSDLRHVRLQYAHIRTQIRQSLHSSDSPEKLFDLKVGQLVSYTWQKKRANFFSRGLDDSVEQLERAPVHVAMISEVSPKVKIIHMTESKVQEQTLNEALNTGDGPYHMVSMKSGSYDATKAVRYMREQMEEGPGYDQTGGLAAHASKIGVSKSVLSLFGFFGGNPTDQVTCSELVDNAIEFAKTGKVDEDDVVPNATYFASELGVDTNMIFSGGEHWA